MGADAAATDVVDFAGHGLMAAKRFLRTAMIIDDEISIPEDRPAAIPEIIVPPPFAAAAPAQSARKKVEAPVAASPAGEQTAARPEEAPPAEVAIKPLADAFLDKQIVCGVLKPVAADGKKDVVSRAVKAAEVADIVILDWYLKPADNTLALAILQQILEGDKEQNGRLRLIVVYTSADPLDERCQELKKHLEGAGFKCSIPAAEILIVANCRIRFVKKHDGKNGVPVEVLPDLAIGEFAKHSNGLLSNFALLGIAALRESTHHLLAVLDRRLDPAFVGHRMMIGDTDDAHAFAMSMFLMQMKGVLTQPHHLGDALGDNEIRAWFEDRFKGGEIDKKLGEMKAPRNDLMNQMLAPGLKKVPLLYSALFIPDAEHLGRDASEIEAEASRDFSRLATYVREFDGHHPLPKGWQPRLTLGSMVRLEGDTPKYLLCLQPACDTVRIVGKRFFPFIELEKSSERVDYLVVHGNAEPSVRGVSGKPGGRHYDEFMPDEKKKCILASPLSEGGKTTSFVFESTSMRKYTWLGDISPMKAQRIAVELAGELSRVGLDEFEWLRRGGRA
ncbi:response regulator receiver domain [Xanthobacteraceae bacterium A53D]